MPVLAIFPEGSLASSVITTVWIGVFVITFFNMRFGWGLSGLVVPGYLVPLILIKPWAVVAITIEGAAAYLMVYWLCRLLEASGFISEFFGRDRFFVLILASVLVRMGFDELLFPTLGQWMVEHLNINFDYSDNLHSFGLIIVALIANSFWKPGLRIGLFWYLSMLAITAVIVRYGLMEFTNFGLSNLSYLYEDIASSMLASPKAYIILLTTAYIASRMNLIYSWEFSGILIPSLLALQWYQPLKIMFTLAETLVIYLLALAVLRLPMFSDKDISGSRQLLLFFNISFAYKFIVGLGLQEFFPNAKVTDYYAFGYLLSTLLAIKIYNKRIVGQATYATLHTSIIGVLAASVIGFSLSVTNFNLVAEKDVPYSARHVQELDRAALTTVLNQHHLDVYKNTQPGIPYTPTLGEQDVFRRGLAQLKKFMAGGTRNDLNIAANIFREIDYATLLLGGRYVVLRDNSERYNRGLYIIDSAATSQALVEIAHARTEQDSADIGVAYFKQLQARALVVADTDIMDDAQLALSLYYSFHKTFHASDTLRLRTYNQSNMRVFDESLTDSATNIATLPNSLWITGSLPPSVDLTRLTATVGNYRTFWASPPTQRKTAGFNGRGIAELFINFTTSNRMLLGDAPADPNQPHVYHQISGRLHEWLMVAKDDIARAGSDLYHHPEFAELVYLDQAVVTPLMTLRDRLESVDELTPTESLELSRIAQRAQLVNMQISVFENLSDQSYYLILSDNRNAPQRYYWGTYILRRGARQDVVIGVPHPLFEAQTFEFGSILLRALDADALLIAGSHPKANLDGRGDVSNLHNGRTPYNLLHTAILRQVKNQPFLSIQVRGVAYREKPPPTDDHFLISFSTGPASAPTRIESPLRQHLINTFATLGFRSKLVNGDNESAGYDNPLTPQLQYVFAAANKIMATVWLTPYSRASYRDRRDDRLQQATFDALDIETRNQDVRALLKRTELAPLPETTEKQVIATLKQYVSNRNVVALAELTLMRDQVDAVRLLDPNTGLSFLAFFAPNGQLGLLANLFPISDNVYRLAKGTVDDRIIDEFMISGQALLRPEKSQ